MGIQLVHLLFLGVVVMERQPENDSNDNRRDSDARIHPHDVWVASGGYQSLVEGGTDGGGEKVKGLHEGLHARGCFSVGVFETSDRDEDLGQANEDVRWGLDGDVDVIGKGLAIGRRAGWAVQRVRVARAGAIDEMLHDGSVRQANSSKEKAYRDASNGLEFNFGLAKGRVDNLIQDRNEDDDADRIEVLHEIVGHAMPGKLCSLAHKVRAELSVAHPKNGVEAEDLASHQRPLQLVDEVIVPRHHLAFAIRRTPRRLRGVGVEVGDHESEGLKGIRNDRPLRRPNDVPILAEHKNADSDTKH